MFRVTVQKCHASRVPLWIIESLKLQTLYKKFNDKVKQHATRLNVQVGATGAGNQPLLEHGEVLGELVMMRNSFLQAGVVSTPPHPPPSLACPTHVARLVLPWHRRGRNKPKPKLRGSETPTRGSSATTKVKASPAQPRSSRSSWSAST